LTVLSLLSRRGLGSYPHCWEWYLKGRKCRNVQERCWRTEEGVHI